VRDFMNSSSGSNWDRCSNESIWFWLIACGSLPKSSSYWLEITEKLESVPVSKTFLGFGLFMASKPPSTVLDSSSAISTF
jgi:hypothetical protein